MICKLLGRVADKKMETLGFVKKSDNEYVVEYERLNPEYGYTQAVAICHKKRGEAIVQSYDPNLFDEKKIGNTCVGLTYEEMSALAIKMKSKGWK